MFDLLGLLVAISRLVEPYVFYTFLTHLESLKCCCFKVNKMESKYNKQALCSFASSILNVEYVYLILVGVQQFMEKDPDQEVKDNTIQINKNSNSTRVMF